ncbi:MAG: phenylalanine--tRNA ligase subunit alpha [Armatimonadetes bacterium]|nr:phenylalanine--tRNA ligase subunit alpha [Armatimonadota bacterium]
MSENDILQSLRNAALASIHEAKNSAQLDSIETQYLGRKGEITSQLRRIGSLPAEERKDFGQAVNDAKEAVDAAITARREALVSVEADAKFVDEAIDVTMPGRLWHTGRSHILVDTLQRIKEIFIGMGYEFVETPEIEDYKSNFEALNYPEEHPALDEQMSFYITDDTLLRTHTTAFQHQVMSNRKPPMRVATLGKCYRSDAVDATHSHTFHQVDCFTIDRGISMADLKGTIHQFAVEMFGREVNVRFRPDFFPFVEPGAEFSVTCIICGGDGCNVCKGSGFLELGGAGLIHPNILTAHGFDPEEYSGFAFGFGIERMPMLMYGIRDLRLFMENDMRFLRQL